MKQFIEVVLFSALGLAAIGQQHTQSRSSAVDPNRQKALELEQAGNVAEAETAWTAASKANTRNPEPYAHLALLKARKEEFKEAVPLYRKALALDPNVPAVRLNLGLALFKSEQMKDAIV